MSSRAQITFFPSTAVGGGISVWGGQGVLTGEAYPGNTITGKGGQWMLGGTNISGETGAALVVPWNVVAGNVISQNGISITVPVFDTDARDFAQSNLYFGQVKRLSALAVAVKAAGAWSDIVLVPCQLGSGSTLTSFGGWAQPSFTLVGSPTRSSDGITLNGTSQYATTPDFYSGGTAMSIWASVTPSSLVDGQTVISCNRSDTNDRSFRFSQSFAGADAGKVAMTLSSDGQAATQSVYAGPLVEATESEWGVIVNGATKTAYYAGAFSAMTLESGAGTNSFANPASPILIGAVQTGASTFSGFLHGLVRFVAMARVAVSQANYAAIKLAIQTFDLGYASIPATADFHDNSHTGLIAPAIAQGTAVRLIYTTTAEHINIGFDNDWVGVFQDKFRMMNIAVGGVNTANPFTLTAGKHYARVALPPGRKTLEITAPYRSYATVAADFYSSWITEVYADAALNLVAPAAPAARLHAVVDSIGCGNQSNTGAIMPRDGAFCLLRQQIPVILNGYGSRALYTDGSNATDRQALAVEIAASAPSIVWLQLCINDHRLNLWSAPAFQAAYADLLDKIHTLLPLVPIYAQSALITTGFEAANGLGYTAQNYRDAVQAAAAGKAMVTFVDGLTLMTAAGLTGGDMLHPVTSGHFTYYGSIRAVLHL